MIYEKSGETERQVPNQSQSLGTRILRFLTRDNPTRTGATADPGYGATSVIRFDGGAPNERLLPEPLFDRTREAQVRAFQATINGLKELTDAEIHGGAHALFADYQEGWEAIEEAAMKGEQAGV